MKKNAKRDRPKKENEQNNSPEQDENLKMNDTYVMLVDDILMISSI